MIPVRVLLTNFLCYGTAPDGGPVELDFDGARLWSISGDNGAGKSAIFDAITYALFGRHRGGAQRDSRLIRSGEARCEVALEFRVNGELYRIIRTVERPRGKAKQDKKGVHAAWFDPDVRDWRSIDGTDRDRGLEAWVQSKLAVGYDTFVASTLLLQGESDKLIGAPPRDRFNILAGLLNLEVYKRLERAALDRAKAAAGEVSQIDAELERLPAVTAEALRSARDAVEVARRIQEEAEAAVTQAELRLIEAKRFALLQADLGTQRVQLAELDSLLRDAPKIRAEHAEWIHLKDNLPKAQAALKELDEADRLRREATTVQQSADAIDLDALQTADELASRAEQETREKAAAIRQRVDALAQAVPVLRSFLAATQDAERRDKALEKAGTPAMWRKEVNDLDTEATRAKDSVKTARAQARTAVSAQGRARAALDSAQTQLHARLEAKGEGVCARCGQPIDEAHIKQEVATARAAVMEAKRRLEDATHATEAAEHEAARADAQLEKAQNRLERARTGLIESQGAAAAGDEATATLRAARTQVATLPPQFRRGVVGRPLAEATRAVQAFEGALRESRSEAKRLQVAEDRARAQARKAHQAHLEANRKLTELRAEVERLQSKAQALTDRAVVRLTSLDPQWRAHCLARDEQFIRSLERRRAALEGIDQRVAQLDHASRRRDKVLASIAVLERQEGDVPQDHRVPIYEAEGAVTAAKAQRQTSEADWATAMEQRRTLEAAQTRREELQQASRDVRQRQARYSRLADLLGRTRLQATLVDDAVQGITALANETLARISGGELELTGELVADSSGEQEVQILATDLASSDEPLGVHFLSGSQKFRVSVALAAAIGQYIGGGASMQSLIIDEGFGSLDQQGRQQMIDELRNLSNHLERLIVVSHQEDFQDRTLFPTGYVLAKNGRRTTVERFF